MGGSLPSRLFHYPLPLLQPFLAPLPDQVVQSASALTVLSAAWYPLNMRLQPLLAKVDTALLVKFWALLCGEQTAGRLQCGACSPQISAGVPTINGLALLPTEMSPGQTSKQKTKCLLLAFSY